MAFRLLGRDDQIDDVVQDMFMVAMRNLHRLRDPGALKGWLATITVRFSGRLCDCSLSAAKRRIDAADQAIQRMLSDA